MDESVDYGNWVPRTLIYLGIDFFMTPLILSIILPGLVLKVILWVITGIFIFPLIYVLGLTYHFSKNDGEVQHTIRNIVIAGFN